MQDRPALGPARASMDPNSMNRNLLDYRDYQASTSWEDLLAEEARDKKPWRKVALAVFLCLTGAVLLTIGLVVFYKTPVDGLAIALLVLGCICFLPGFYHTRIAYLAWKRVPGYSLNDIPDM